MDGFIPEGMSTQAQQIWSMLDDMAENNPAAYRKFIEQQMKESKEQLAPPDPHMCVQVMLLGKPPEPLFINFMSWKKVPEPKTPEDPVPVSGAPITHEKDGKGTCALTSVAFNPRVLEEFGRSCKNQVDADTLVQLALDYIENEQKVKLSRAYTVLPESTSLKGDLEHVRLSFTKAFQNAHNNKNAGAGDGRNKKFEKDISELEKTFGPLSSNERESLMSQLSNISVSSPQQKDASINKGQQRESHQKSSGAFTSSDFESGIRIPGVSSTSSTSPHLNGLSRKEDQNGPKKSSLIQEISEDKLATKAPKYTLDTIRDADGKMQLLLKVELPSIKSVTECELDISEDDVKLIVPGKHDWRVKLPSYIDKDLARARFSKKTSTLTLTMPVQT